jgi:hypothetical protein
VPKPAQGEGGEPGRAAAAQKPPGAAAEKCVHVSFAGDNAVLHQQLAALAAQVAELCTVRLRAVLPLGCSRTHLMRRMTSVRLTAAHVCAVLRRRKR